MNSCQINQKKRGNSVTVITFANFKGGVGKTTNTCMTGYALAKKGYKVLIVDKDPQANVTTFFLSTMEQNGQPIPEMKYLLEGIQDGSLVDCVMPVNENLDIIPTIARLQFYQRVLNHKFRGYSEEIEMKRVTYFGSLIDEIKDNYDFVFIDVPPTISIFTDAALYVTDYVVVVLQTQQRSLQGAEIFIEYLNEIIVKDYKHQLDVAGVLPVIMKPDSLVDQATLINAENFFGTENLFKTQIKQMERLKRYDITGITNVDHHDKRALDVYNAIADELLERIGKAGVTAR